jgi:ubiquinone/menaquinone biosynthesis C-methylase UbiE
MAAHKNPSYFNFCVYENSISFYWCINAGANLKLLPKGSHLVMLDPNESFRPLLEKNLKAHPSLQMERFVLGKAEEMSAVSDESVDAVVCTLVLCSVDRIPAVLSEVRRVLVPVSRAFPAPTKIL